MGELSKVLERLVATEKGLPINNRLLETLLAAKQIEIIYTPRLKNGRTQWLVQLRYNGKVEAIGHAAPELAENQAYGLLVKESKELSDTLHFYLPTLTAPIIGYYHMGNSKEANFGKLR